MERKVARYSILFHGGKSSPRLFEAVEASEKTSKMKIAMRSTGNSWLICAYHLYISGRYRVVRLAHRGRDGVID